MNQTSIHLKENTVEIEVIRNGQRSIKNTNIQAIQEVLTRNERTETPLLPYGWGVQKYTRVNNREQYVIATPQTIHTAKYDMRDETGDEEFPEYKIVAPATVWIIHTEVNPGNDTRRYIHGVAFAVKQQILSLNDRLYRFPFSNSNDTYLCWGTERDYPVLGASKSIQTVPDRFFSNPFNSDLDGRKYNPIEEEVNGRTVVRERCIHLLQHLDKKVKEAEEKVRLQYLTTLSFMNLAIHLEKQFVNLLVRI